MLILSIFTWWYGAGLKEQILKIRMLFVKVNDQFSLKLLFKTLFQPFRQISAGSVDGALEVKIRAWFDRLVSRIIGAFIRSGVIFAGVISIFFVAVISLLRIIFWVILPILPFVGIFLMSEVGIPWTQ